MFHAVVAVVGAIHQIDLSRYVGNTAVDIAFYKHGAGKGRHMGILTLRGFVHRRCYGIGGSFPAPMHRQRGANRWRQRDSRLCGFELERSASGCDWLQALLWHRQPAGQYRQRHGHGHHHHLRPASTWPFATTHYWQVVPYNAIGSASDCPVWSFSTLDCASNPTPANGASGVLTDAGLRWNAASSSAPRAVAGYKLYLGTYNAHQFATARTWAMSRADPTRRSGRGQTTYY